MSSPHKSEADLLRALGGDLEGFGTHEGRIDLRGVTAGFSGAVSRGPVAGTERVDVLRSQGLMVRGVDLSIGRIAGWRILGCQFVDCSFDGGRFPDLRTWETTFTNCSFRSAKLRDAVLGPMSNGGHNVYEGVNFDGADLRGAVFSYCRMVRCSFNETRLDGVQFGLSEFDECSFSGRLKDVIFGASHEGARVELPIGGHPNRLRRVDFRSATFEYVEFRNVDADDIRWPQNIRHIVFERGFRRALESMIAHFSTRQEPDARALAAAMKVELTWLGRRDSGVVSIDQGGLSDAIKRELENVARQAVSDSLD